VEEVTVHPITRHRHNRFVRRRRRRSYPPAFGASSVDVDRPSEGTAGTIESCCNTSRHVSRVYPPGRVVLGDCFYAEFSKYTTRTNSTWSPCFSPAFGFACSAYQKIVSLMSIYIYIYTDGDGCTSGIAANTIVWYFYICKRVCVWNFHLYWSHRNCIFNLYILIYIHVLLKSSKDALVWRKLSYFIIILRVCEALGQLREAKG